MIGRRYLPRMVGVSSGLGGDPEFALQPSLDYRIRVPPSLLVLLAEVVTQLLWTYLQSASVVNSHAMEIPYSMFTLGYGLGGHLL